MVQPSHPYLTTGRSIALTIWTSVGKVMSLFYNMLSRFVISFLPRSKRLLISWLQSPSIVILEPKKIKVCTVSIVSPFTVTTRHIHNWPPFPLWLSLFILSEKNSLLFPSNTMNTYQPGRLITQFQTVLPFHTVHGALKSRILKWFAIPFSSGPGFIRSLHHDPSSWVALHGMAHSFIELHKAVIHIFILVVDVWLLSHVWLFVIPWTAAHQASLSLTISWSLLKLSLVSFLWLWFLFCLPSDGEE